MLKRCTWHEKYFGYVLMMGEKQPYSDLSITDTMCPRCVAIEFLAIEIHRIERETIRLKEVIQNATIR